MKKVIFIVCFVIFLFQFYKVKADEVCQPDNTPVIQNATDFFYEIGQPIPNYLENVTAVDSCGEAFNNITVVDNFVDYTNEGEYKLYYYAHETVVIVKVYVYEDIPIIEGIKDLYIEVNSTPVNYLDGVSARNVYNGNSLTSDIEIDDSDIDYSTVGQYELIYSVTDHLGNETVKTVQVYIQDTVKPIIQNYKNLTLLVHSNLNEFDFWEGITVSDNSLKNVSTAIDKSRLKINQIGEYEIEYIAIDESNNEIRVPVKVKVVDTTKPEIKNATDLSFLVNTPINKSMLTENVRLEDNYDGNISLEYLTVDYRLVDVAKPGVYPVFYYISDSSGNYQYQTISVKIYDEDFPKISNTVDIRIPVFTENIDYLENIVCQDTTDGDLTSQVIVYDDLVDLSHVGSYPLTYMIYDSSGNVDVKQVKVIVFDSEKPVFSGIADLTIEVHEILTKAYFLTNVTAYDNHDKDITQNIDVDISQINFNELGTYTIRYFVSDSSHNMVEETVSVTVVDSTAPIISGYQDITIRINDEVNETLLLNGVTAMDNYDGDVTALLSISGFYDSSKVGEYPLVIEVKDTHDNIKQVTIKLIVLSKDGKIEDEINDYSILYIIGGIGLSLIVTGFLGYRSRHR